MKNPRKLLLLLSFVFAISTAAFSVADDIGIPVSYVWDKYYGRIDIKGEMPSVTKDSVFEVWRNGSAVGNFKVRTVGPQMFAGVFIPFDEGSALMAGDSLVEPGYVIPRTTILPSEIIVETQVVIPPVSAPAPDTVTVQPQISIPAVKAPSTSRSTSKPEQNNRPARFGQKRTLPRDLDARIKYAEDKKSPSPAQPPAGNSIVISSTPEKETIIEIKGRQTPDTEPDSLTEITQNPSVRYDIESTRPAEPETQIIISPSIEKAPPTKIDTITIDAKTIIDNTDQPTPDTTKSIPAESFAKSAPVDDFQAVRGVEIIAEKAQPGESPASTIPAELFAKSAPADVLQAVRGVEIIAEKAQPDDFEKAMKNDSDIVAVRRMANIASTTDFDAIIDEIDHLGTNTPHKDAAIHPGSDMKTKKHDSENCPHGHNKPAPQDHIKITTPPPFKTEPVRPATLPQDIIIIDDDSAAPAVIGQAPAFTTSDSGSPDAYVAPVKRALEKAKNPPPSPDPAINYNEVVTLIQIGDYYFFKGNYSIALKLYGDAYAITPWSVEIGKRVTNTRKLLGMPSPIAQTPAAPTPTASHEPHGNFSPIITTDGATTVQPPIRVTGAPNYKDPSSSQENLNSLDLSSAQNNYAVHLIMQGKYADAIKWADIAISNNPSVGAYYRNRAIANYYLADYGAVGRDLRKALELGDKKTNELISAFSNIFGNE